MWELRPESLALLDARLAELSPGLIVEAGSGESTRILSGHAPTISLEHVARYAQRSRRLAPAAEVRLCSIRPFHTPAGTFRWYDTQLPGRIDFALIDGPPLQIGREAAFLALAPYLTDGAWEVWLDDADRAHEQGCLTLWRRFHRFTVDYPAPTLARLRPGS